MVGDVTRLTGAILRADAAIAVDSRTLGIVCTASTGPLVSADRGLAHRAAAAVVRLIASSADVPADAHRCAAATTVVVGWIANAADPCGTRRGATTAVEVVATRHARAIHAVGLAAVADAVHIVATGCTIVVDTERRRAATGRARARTLAVAVDHVAVVSGRVAATFAVVSTAGAEVVAITERLVAARIAVVVPATLAATRCHAVGRVPPAPWVVAARANPSEAVIDLILGRAGPVTGFALIVGASATARESTAELVVGTTVVIGGIAVPTGAVRPDADRTVARVLLTFSVTATRPALTAARIADRRCTGRIAALVVGRIALEARAVDAHVAIAARVIALIAQAAEVPYALVEVSAAIRTVLVRPTGLAARGIARTDGGCRALVAACRARGIAGLAAGSDTFVPRARASDAVGVISTAATGSVADVADGRIGVLQAAVVIGGIALGTGLIFENAHVPVARALLALQVVGPIACATGQRVRIADRRHALLGASLVRRRVTQSTPAVETDVEDARTSGALVAARTGSASSSANVADGLDVLLVAARLITWIAGLAVAANALLEIAGSVETILVTGACAAREVVRVADRCGRRLLASVVLHWITGPAFPANALPAGAIPVAKALHAGAGRRIVFADECTGVVASTAAFAIDARIGRFAARHIAALTLIVRVGVRTCEIAAKLIDAAARMVIAGIAELTATVDTLVLVAGSIHALGVVDAGAALPRDLITDRRRGPAGRVGGRNAAFAAPGLVITFKVAALAVVQTCAAGHHLLVLTTPWRVPFAAVVAVGLTGHTPSIDAEVQVHFPLPRPREALRMVRASHALERLDVTNGRVRRLRTAGVIGRIARLASAAGHALIGIPRPGYALVVGIAGPARQRRGVTNG